jgi:anti-sigma factor RsiW
MKCPIETHEIKEWLVEYGAGRLEGERASLFESHLEECAACRGMVRDQRVVWRALDAWDSPPVPEDFDRRLYQRIDCESRRSWWERVTRPRAPVPLGRWLPLAAAACLLVMAGALLDHRRALPVLHPGEEASVESVEPDQVERTLEDMELLRQFNQELRAEAQTSNPM